MSDHELVALSDEVLATMRRAAQIAIERREAFVTPRSILLALMEEPVVGPALSDVIDRDRLASAKVDENFSAVRLIDDRMPSETPAIARYDTLAFKTPDGSVSMWLSREGFRVFVEGSHRVEERYLPKHLALGAASDSLHEPGILAAMRLEPGKIVDALRDL